MPTDQIPDDLASLARNADNEPFVPFCADLDEYLPLEQAVSSENRATIISGKMMPLVWARHFNDAGVKNGEAEMLMGRILTEAVTAGQWVKVKQPDDSSLDAQFPDVHATMGITPSQMFGVEASKLEFQRAGQILANHSYVEFEQDDDGSQYLKPTKKLIDYYKSRCI